MTGEEGKEEIKVSLALPLLFLLCYHGDVFCEVCGDNHDRGWGQD